MCSRSCLTQISKAPAGRYVYSKHGKPHLKPQRGDMWQFALESLEQEEIDAQIAQIAADSEYQKLHGQLAKEYDPAGWEALRLGEDSS